MKVGGNSCAKEFFQCQPDISPEMCFSDKYNSKTAALYRDKVPTSFSYVKRYDISLMSRFWLSLKIVIGA